MDPISKVQLGRTKLQVTRLGLGSAPLAGLYHNVAEDTAVSIVRRALAMGIGLIDTAPYYGNGKSELLLGRALAGVDPTSYVLATKAGRLLLPSNPASFDWHKYENPAPFKAVFDFSYDGIMRSFEESRKRLGVERIDILHIHDPDEHYEEAIGTAYPVLDRLRNQGLIGTVGCGMDQAEMLVRFAREGNFDCFVLAGRYTLIDHSGLKELLPLCLEKRISIIIGGPYNSGILATGARPGATFNYVAAPPEIMEKVRKAEAVCQRHSVPLKAAALQFPLAHQAVAAVIPGARSVAELEENFQMMRHPIPEDFWVDLRRTGLIPPEAPTPQAA